MAPPPPPPMSSYILDPSSTTMVSFALTPPLVVLAWLLLRLRVEALVVGAHPSLMSASSML